MRLRGELFDTSFENMVWLFKELRTRTVDIVISDDLQPGIISRKWIFQKNSGFHRMNVSVVRCVNGPNCP